MSTGLRVVAACLLLAIAAPGAVAAPLPAEIEGRWVLVEQRYQDGGVNLAVSDPALHLEIAAEGGEIVGRLQAGSDPESSFPWPAALAGGSPLDLEVVERRGDPDGRGILARYRIRPNAADDLVLDVVERYRVVDDGGALEGTVEIRFVGGTSNRGGYTLHRRFERVR